LTALSIFFGLVSTYKFCVSIAFPDRSKDQERSLNFSQLLKNELYEEQASLLHLNDTEKTVQAFILKQSKEN